MKWSIIDRWPTHPLLIQVCVCVRADVSSARWEPSGSEMGPSRRSLGFPWAGGGTWDLCVAPDFTTAESGGNTPLLRFLFRGIFCL